MNMLAWVKFPLKSSNLLATKFSGPSALLVTSAEKRLLGSSLLRPPGDASLWSCRSCARRPGQPGDRVLSSGAHHLTQQWCFVPLVILVSSTKIPGCRVHHSHPLGLYRDITSQEALVE